MLWCIMVSSWQQLRRVRTESFVVRHERGWGTFLGVLLWLCSNKNHNTWSLVHEPPPRCWVEWCLMTVVAVGRVISAEHLNQGTIWPCIVKLWKSSCTQLTHGSCVTKRGKHRQRHRGDLFWESQTEIFLSSFWTAATRDGQEKRALVNSFSEGHHSWTCRPAFWGSPGLGYGNRHLWAMLTVVFVNLSLKFLFTPNTQCNVSFLHGNQWQSFQQ